MLIFPPLNHSWDVFTWSKVHITMKHPIYLPKCESLPALGTLNDLWKLHAQTNSDCKAFFSLRYDSVLQLKARCPNIGRLTLQSTVWWTLISGLIEMERVNKSNDEVKILWTSWLYFYPLTSLSFLADEPDLIYI